MSDQPTAVPAELIPYIEAMNAARAEATAAVQKTNGLLWKLSMIPQSALSREGEDREKLLRRAETLEAGLVEAVRESERLKLASLLTDMAARLAALRLQTQGRPRATEAVEAFAQDVEAAGEPVGFDPERIGRATLAGIRLEREARLRMDATPGPDLMAAHAEFREASLPFEQWQQRLLEVEQRHQPALKRALESADS